MPGGMAMLVPVAAAAATAGQAAPVGPARLSAA